MQNDAQASLPVIDIAPLAGNGAAAAEVGAAIDRACRESGFFYVVGHGVDPEALRRLDRVARSFFALEPEEKMRIRMALGGRAWRGYFPVGAELSSAPTIPRCARRRRCTAGTSFRSVRPSCVERCSITSPR
jgi:isopenicillin N synthase-like dioxygenase